LKSVRKRCSAKPAVYLCLIFSPSIARVKTSVTPFARMIGSARSRMPYTSQRKTPVHIIRYILRLISFDERVLQTFTNCGTNAAVVRIAAMNPIVSVN